MAKQDQRRDAADVEAPGELRLLVRIDLADLQGRRALLRGAIQYRRHHLARAAPRGPEVHQHGQASLGRVSREGSRIEGNDLPLHQLGFALRALGMLAHAIGRSPHD